MRIFLAILGALRLAGALAIAAAVWAPAAGRVCGKGRAVSGS
jgi:hypothetical protein